MKHLVLGLASTLLLSSGVMANPKASFELARQAYRRGDLQATQRALQRTWKLLPTSHRGGSSGLRVLAMLARTQAKAGSHLHAGVTLGRVLAVLEGSPPVDRDKLGAARRLLLELAMEAPSPPGPQLLERAEQSSSPAARRTMALAAEVLLRSASEFGDAADLCRLARVLLLFPGQDPRRAEATKVMIDAAATGEPVALEQLADWYLDGLGVPRNLDMARRYYSLAALEGSATAAAKAARLGEDATTSAD